MLEFIKEPWPWYVAGPLLGVTVPILLLLGKKSFGVSSTFRHICAACVPANIPFFQYDWRKEVWNFFFVGGVALGSFLAVQFLSGGVPLKVAEPTAAYLASKGITDNSGLLPSEIFSWSNLFTWRGFIFFIAGGFLIGFGTRWAGGCTSGHSIMGLSNLQWPSLVATCCFMIGGIVSAWFVVPYLLTL
jgi:uncharacterized membrane protein YedE/YeeE